MTFFLCFSIFETYGDVRIRGNLLEKVKLCDYKTILEKEQNEVMSKLNLLNQLRRQEHLMADRCSFSD